MSGSDLIDLHATDRDLSSKISRPSRFASALAVLFAAGVTLAVLGALLVESASSVKLLKDIRTGSGSSNPDELTAVNGTLFFAADDGPNGIELWKSDGTAAGTSLGFSSPQISPIFADGLHSCVANSSNSQPLS